MTVSEYLKYFKNKGKYTLGTILPNGHFSYRHLRITDKAFEEAAGKENCYISMNGFKWQNKRYRCSENVTGLNMLYVDLDCYKTDEVLTDAELEWRKQGVVYELEQGYFGSKLPAPSFIIDSGRGLYLQWLLEEADSDTELWHKVTVNLVALLKAYGADTACTDPARLMRLPGTINTKNGNVVKIIGGTGDTVGLQIFADEYGLDKDTQVTAEKKSRKKAQNSPKNTPVVAAGNSFAVVNFVCKNVESNHRYSLYANRISDLYLIADKQVWDRTDSCKKEVMCFLMRYWLLCYGYTPEAALGTTLNFNKRFSSPLEESYVISRTASAEKAYSSGTTMYNYKNETLIKLLGIEGAEEALQLKSIISDKERKRRKAKRNREYYRTHLCGSTKAEKIAKRREALLVLLLKGKSVAYICEALRISRRTYYSDFEVVKERFENAVEAAKVACAKNSATKLKGIYNTSYFASNGYFNLPQDIFAAINSLHSPPVLEWWREDSSLPPNTNTGTDTA